MTYKKALFFSRRLIVRTVLNTIYNRLGMKFLTVRSSRRNYILIHDYYDDSILQFNSVLCITVLTHQLQEPITESAQGDKINTKNKTQDNTYIK
jgi:hypothetical protein